MTNGLESGLLAAATRPTIPLQFVAGPVDPTQRVLTLHPGEKGSLLRLTPKDLSGLGRAMRILSIAATQHPKSLYTYTFDSATFRVPAPIGTFINPLYTCRDLGAHLLVRGILEIAVENNDTKAHHYVAQVLYVDEPLGYTG